MMKLPEGEGLVIMLKSIGLSELSFCPHKDRIDFILIKINFISLSFICQKQQINTWLNSQQDSLNFEIRRRH